MLNVVLDDALSYMFSVASDLLEDEPGARAERNLVAQLILS